MKALRLWLLMVVIAMLAFRGMAATAMMIPDSDDSAPAAMHLMSAEAGGHDAMTGMQHEVGVDHADHEADAGGHHAAGSGSCHLCCDFCTMTPLIMTQAMLAQSTAAQSISFPSFHAPAPSFLSDGQERPPRSS